LLISDFIQHFLVNKHMPSLCQCATKAQTLWRSTAC
jgi:hypothetical protein